MVTTATVRGDGVTLAVTDHGGQGPTLVLTHGLGGSQRALRKLVPQLTPYVRLVTYDLRGHGRSSYGEWTWSGAVADLESVVRYTGEPTAAVAGHSLGGMVSAMYAVHHAECAGAINIDGWGTGTVDLYPDVDPAVVSAWLTRTQAGDVPALKVLAAIMSFLPQGEQRVALQHAVMRELATTDLMNLHAEAKAPLLAFNANGPARGLQKLLVTKSNARLLEAYRKGIHLRLQQLSAAHPHLQEVQMPTADHALILTHPEETARHILHFLNIDTKVWT